MFDKFLDLFKKKEKPMPERVQQAAAVLPESVKNLSIAQLATKINKMNRPNKWALTRRASQGMQKSSHGGNQYPSSTSEARAARRKKQIEKGMIKITEAK